MSLRKKIQEQWLDLKIMVKLLIEDSKAMDTLRTKNSELDRELMRTKAVNHGWAKKFDILKDKVNQRMVLAMGGDSANLRAMEKRFEHLRSLINGFLLDDEPGPDIEEVD